MSEKPESKLVPQAHGGALHRGGVPGNKGGSGRPPSAVRASARASFDELMPKLKTIAKSRKSRDVDKIRAIDVLGKYGMDQAVSIADVRAALKETSDVIREFMPPEQAEELLRRIRPIWLSL